MDDAIEGLTSICQWSIEFNNTTYNIASYVTAAILSILLVFVVWALSTNKENAKAYVITWFILLMFAITFILK